MPGCGTMQWANYYLFIYSFITILHENVTILRDKNVRMLTVYLSFWKMRFSDTSKIKT